MFSRFIRVSLIVLFTLVPAFGHKLSDSYLHFEITNDAATGQWHIALRDLHYAVGLDANQNLEITWEELKNQSDAICAYASRSLNISSGSKEASVMFNDLLVTEHSDGKYAVLPFVVSGLVPRQGVQIRYDLLFDNDLQHRGLLRLTRGGDVATHVFSHARRDFTLDLEGAPANSFGLFFGEGIWHIWKGIDHVLFLFALLLPSVLARKEGVWHAADDFRKVAFQVLKVVTAFTLAHSITLTLATLEIVTITARWIEPVIAVSVVIAALNNVFGWFEEKLWLFALGFGLIHGFGFAFVLQDLGLSRATLFQSLLGFNLGVEAGQIMIVLAVLPLAFLIRCTYFYRRYVLQFGSAAIALVATTWMLERMFTFKLLPF